MDLDFFKMKLTCGCSGKGGSSSRNDNSSCWIHVLLYKKISTIWNFWIIAGQTAHCRLKVYCRQDKGDHQQHGWLCFLFDPIRLRSEPDRRQIYLLAAWRSNRDQTNSNETCAMISCLGCDIETDRLITKGLSRIIQKFRQINKNSCGRFKHILWLAIL